MSQQPIGFEPRGYNPHQPRPSWIARNGCWFLPALGVLILLPVICCGGAIFWVKDLVEAPRDAAMSAIQTNERVIAELGSPIETTGGSGISNMRLNNGNGTADINFRIRGPNGTASVEGKMISTDSVWTHESLKIVTDANVEIELRDPAPPNDDGPDF